MEDRKEDRNDGSSRDSRLLVDRSIAFVMALVAVVLVLEYPNESYGEGDDTACNAWVLLVVDADRLLDRF